MGCVREAAGACERCRDDMCGLHLLQCRCDTGPYCPHCLEYHMCRFGNTAEAASPSSSPSRSASDRSRRRAAGDFVETRAATLARVLVQEEENARDAMGIESASPTGELYARLWGGGLIPSSTDGPDVTAWSYVLEFLMPVTLEVSARWRTHLWDVTACRTTSRNGCHSCYVAFGVGLARGLPCLVLSLIQAEEVRDERERVHAREYEEAEAAANGYVLWSTPSWYDEDEWGD